MKKRIVVVCPGRGSYTKENLKTLEGRSSVASAVQSMDDARVKLGYPSLTELDSAPQFKTSTHTKGEHASPLIYACALADFLEIYREEFEIVAITGNSMGWYLTLAMAGALDVMPAFELIQTMGAMMKNGLIGGQIIYPVVDENWNYQSSAEDEVFAIINEINKQGGHQAHVSIRLGGYRVLAGNKPGLNELMKRLPKIDNYPFQLVNHGAFHTPLLDEVSDRAFRELKDLALKSPTIPMVDGRGHIWQSYNTDVDRLLHYTLGHQVTETYDFTKSIEVALKEFAPDHLVLLGPGNSLGGAIGQIMIENKWLGIKNKAEFIAKQKSAPFLISMGVAEQKRLLSHPSEWITPKA